MIFLVTVIVIANEFILYSLTSNFVTVIVKKTHTAVSNNYDLSECMFSHAKRRRLVTMWTDALRYEGPATVRVSALKVYDVPRFNPLIAKSPCVLLSSTYTFDSCR